MVEPVAAEGLEEKLHGNNNSNNVNLSASTDQIDAPLVFQCKKCNVIVSDSFAFQAADEGLRAVIVHTACNVSFQANSLITSKKGIDIGSTYMLVNCATHDCKVPLGRLYKTTARHLDHIREMFTFDVDAIKSYKLGSCPSVPELGASNPAPVVPTIQNVQQMEDKLLKTQHLLLLFNEKLAAIEKHLSIDLNSSLSATTATTAVTTPASTPFTTTTNTTPLTPTINTPAAPSKTTQHTPTAATTTSTSTSTTSKTPIISPPTTARPSNKFLPSATTSSSPTITTTSSSSTPATNPSSSSSAAKRDYIGVATLATNRVPPTANNGVISPSATITNSSSIPKQNINAVSSGPDPKKRKKAAF